MNLTRHLPALVVLTLTAIVTAHAHPGHSHADVFTVLSQPLAGWQHGLITGMAAFTVGVLSWIALPKTRVPIGVRLAGSIGAAACVAWVIG